MIQDITSDITFFEDGDSNDKKLLGGKGACLVKMTQLCLPVPAGFIVTTKECERYYSSVKRSLSDSVLQDIRTAMNILEKKTNRVFGDPTNPLLVSVRSGSAVSMPGMMDTVLNVGLNSDTVKGLIKQTGNSRFAYDAYRRFIQLFGKVVLHVKDEKFPKTFDEKTASAQELEEASRLYKEVCEKETGRPFPEDPYQQLNSAIAAVFESWNSKRCIDYRREFKIGPEIANGTAVNIVTMVFGNMGNDSGTGVVFTRDPGTGEKTLYGDYLLNAQGEDVVAGIRTPSPVHELENEMPEAYKELVHLSEKLEKYYKFPQDVEFTIEKGKLYILQTRDAKMNALAKVKVVVDMVKENIIKKEDALKRIAPETLEQILHKRIDPTAKVESITKGIGASPGAASGRVVFDADTAETRGRNGEKIIMVREETKPEDVHGFFASQGILTSRGGKTSHAAVVARGIGKACVVGASEIRIDMVNNQFVVNNKIINEGYYITLDGTTGEVFLGEIQTVEPEPTVEMAELLTFADQIRRLGVRANADTPENARLARSLGAEGIGLCRTERMFNATDRLPTMVSMILAETDDSRRNLLKNLTEMQKQDFKEILTAMEGYPVTIRLLDAPLHEFLPNTDELSEEVRKLKESNTPQSRISEKELVLRKARDLAEVNPMLGHRGVRVGITYPEIYESQIRAICEASAELLKEKIDVKPQVMIPQLALKQELVYIMKIAATVQSQVEKETDVKLNIKYGTMLEVVRACVTADEIAELAEFFSFGTNDLTQAVFSFSREDAENKFLPIYEEKGILKQNPFQTIDRSGVAEIMRIGVNKGRKTRNDIEIGICGEHGGDPSSIEICNDLGLTYVSCSSYRIPIARLASAQSQMKTNSQLKHKIT